MNESVSICIGIGVDKWLKKKIGIGKRLKRFRNSALIKNLESLHDYVERLESIVS